MDGLDGVAHARRRRIEELEARADRPARGVSPWVFLLAAGALLYFITQQRADLAYWLSPRAALNLGVRGEYRLEELVSQRYVELHGVPGRRGLYAREQGRTFVIVAIAETPILLRREALPTEDWSIEAPLPPRPDPRPFSVRGRLVARHEAPRFEQAFVELLRDGELRPHRERSFVLLESVRPTDMWPSVLITAALLGLLGLNAAMFLSALGGRGRGERVV